jgi:hypothetical protein
MADETTENPTVEAVVDEVRKLIAPIQERQTELQRKLESLEERGTDPSDQKVKDLEARLAETEEEIRQTKLQGRNLLPDDKRSDSDTFKELFVKDLDQVRQFARQEPQTAIKRSIDTGLFATGGRMNPEQANRFLDWVLAEQVTLSRIQTMRMMASRRDLDRIQVSKRQIRRAAELTDITPSGAVSTGKRSLETINIGWAEDVSLEFLLDNIEGRSVESTLARVLATQFGNDLNDLGWNGDEAAGAGPDQDFLQVNNGWITLMQADPLVHDDDATGATDPKEVLKNARKLLPHKYKMLPDLTYFAEPGFVEEYADMVADRQTAQGDQVLIGGIQAVRYFGRPVLPDASLDGSGYLTFTPAANLVHGIQLAITFDAEYRPRKAGIEYTIRVFSDFQYTYGDLIVLVENVPTEF